MIVISGALVLVALVLLVLGLTMTDLDFVYGSIGVSLVSFVFLVIGILQRRGEPAAASSPPVSDDAAKADEEPAASAGRPVAQAVPAVTTAAAAPRPSARAAVVEEVDDEELLPGGGPVLVVEGRPRYHVEGCRYLTGRTVEELDVLDARDDGFTACGVCKPDQVLEELYGPLDELDAEPAAPPAADEVEVEDDDVLDTGVPGAGDDEPAPVTARRGRSGGSAKVELDTPAGRTPAKAAKAKAAKAPAKSTAASKPVKAPAAKAAPAAKPVAAAAVKPVAVPAAKPVAAAAAEPVAVPVATAAASPRGKVVVIPDRDRFHVATCRFVRDVAGTEQLTRAQAGKQGYRACGVCKP